jgi:ribosomal subunit interface protein
MHIEIVSKGIDVSAALRDRVEAQIRDSIGKYSTRPGDAHVAVSREGPGFRVDCSVHLDSGAMMQTRGLANDAYAAAEIALERLDKRLRRYKRRIKDRTAARERPEADVAALTVFEGREEAFEAASDTAVNGEPLEESLGEPIVIAESRTEVPTLTVGMAVFDLDLTGAPVLVFRNAAHGGVNVVYRRPDGNVGWIDPERQRSNGA